SGVRTPVRRKAAEPAILVTLQGPNEGRHFTCAAETTTIGRQPDCGVCLESPAVSRHHARIIRDGGLYFVEDLGSSNGTFLNGERIQERHPLTDNDTIQIGPYHFALRYPPRQQGDDTDPVVRSQVNALSSNQSLYSQNAGQKLRVVVEIAQSLGRTLEVKPLLDKLLEQLFRLFPQADRGMVILCEGDQYVVRAQRLRHQRTSGELAGVARDPPGTTGDDFSLRRSLVPPAPQERGGLPSQGGGAALKPPQP